MKIPFWKMHGAGNDFILVDDREELFPLTDKNWMIAVGKRKTGVGCDGFVLIQESEEADFRMRFLNPDGQEVAMCGNGARCISRLAKDIGIADEKMTIETRAGTLHASFIGDQICLDMVEPSNWSLGKKLDLNGQVLEYNYVQCGVPHIVIEVENLETTDVGYIGPKIRDHQAFIPTGTNVNFVKITGPRSFSLRTYERGVEGETLACGTGITAAGLITTKLGRVSSPLKVTCASGDVLEFSCTLTTDGAKNVKLTGPASYSFKGVLESP